MAWSAPMIYMFANHVYVLSPLVSYETKYIDEIENLYASTMLISKRISSGSIKVRNKEEQLILPVIQLVTSQVWTHIFVLGLYKELVHGNSKIRIDLFTD